MNVNLMSQNGENGRNPSKVLVFGDALLKTFDAENIKIENFSEKRVWFMWKYYFDTTFRPKNQNISRNNLRLSTTQKP